MPTYYALYDEREDAVRHLIGMTDDIDQASRLFNRFMTIGMARGYFIVVLEEVTTDSRGEVVATTEIIRAPPGEKWLA